MTGNFLQNGGALRVEAGAGMLERQFLSPCRLWGTVSFQSLHTQPLLRYVVRFNLQLLRIFHYVVETCSRILALDFSDSDIFAPDCRACPEYDLNCESLRNFDDHVLIKLKESEGLFDDFSVCSLI